MVYSERLLIVADSRDSNFAMLQSTVHEVWSRFFGSTLEDRFMYAAVDCFETFPFPEKWDTSPALEAAGKEYYTFRAELMIHNKEGLTKTYNRFHYPDERDPDILQEYYTFRAELMIHNKEGLTKTYNRFHYPDERDPDILLLRELHEKMDRAVLDAYGWTDIATDCQFLLDFEIDEEEYRRRKKPWRYRWPDEVRDMVLARLLALNGERAEQERIAAQAQRDEAAKLLRQMQKV